MQNNNFNYGGYPQSGTYYQPQYQPQQQQYYNNNLRERDKEKKEIFTAGLALGAVLIINLIIQVVGISFVQLSGKYELFNSSFLYQHSANILIVDVIALIVPFAFMALIMRNRYVAPIVPCEKTGFLKSAAWVSVGLAVCYGANILTNGIIELFKQFGYELTKPDTLKPGSAIDCVVLVFSTAIAPAICEEFAMRCSSLGLLRKHGKAFAVIAVSIVFGLLHGNVIQFVFAFTIGLILGYVTIVTDSIVPAILIHALNNGLSVTQDIVTFAVSKKAATYVSAVIIIAFLVAGILGFIYLLTTKQLMPKKELKQPKPYKINFFVKLALLAPGLFVPFLILIYLTSKTIVPIS